MKRHGNLWKEIVSFENLLLSARRAERGKKLRPNVLAFNHELEPNLWTLQEQLTDRSYQPGKYCTFKITEPKHRLISAAPYRDRVVHHALCNIINPIFERTFITDSYANRVGYGSHRALRRFTKFARSNQYILQCDIKKYFPTIDLEILKQLIRRKIKCHDTLWLIDRIIDSSNPQTQVIDYFPGDDLLTPLDRRKGLPLGNLTSQFFANIYLNGLDHFIKEELKMVNYVRYVDDFALFSDDKDLLVDGWKKIEIYLQQLRLKLHPAKTQLFTTAVGASFLGFRVLPDRIRVRGNNLRYGRRRLKRLRSHYLSGRITGKDYRQSVQSWIAHLNHGDTWRLQQQLFDRVIML
jgi:retron-type reverse transcriptase